jgi:DNA modification methylase
LELQQLYLVITGKSTVKFSLFLGDCLERMGEIESGTVDAIITDPPYGLDFRGQAWDAFIPAWLGEARRIAPVVIFTTAPTTLWDYPRPDWVCCWYREASNSRSQLRGGFNHWSPILVYGRPKFPVDSKKLHAIQHAYPRGFPHPSPKPVALLEWLVGNACDEGSTVLDPFMGSGTTGVACVNMGRNFIGIENHEPYFRIASDRIAAAQSATPLLSTLPAPA